MGMCAELSALVIDSVRKIQPDLVIIEQTNLSFNSRYSQKALEWLHYAVIYALIQDSESQFDYISSSEWRSFVGVKMTKEQRLHNKEVKSKKKRGKITMKHLVVAEVNRIYDKQFKLKDNDVCDAILMGTSYLKKHY